MEQSMVEQEISVMRLVRHPKVVELKEVMVKKAKIFFVMEFKKESLERIPPDMLPAACRCHRFLPQPRCLPLRSQWQITYFVGGFLPVFDRGMKSALGGLRTNSVLCCVHGTNTSAGGIRKREGERGWDKTDFLKNFKNWGELNKG